VRAPQYLRYVDDFAIFHDDREFLHAARAAVEAYLARLRLKIHPIKSQIFATKQGANFVGFRIFLDAIRVRSENLRRARRRHQQMQAEYAEGHIGQQELTQALRSWIAHLQHGDTWRLREQIFAALVFTRGAKTGQARPVAARRFVDQPSAQLPQCLPQQERPRQPEQPQRVSGRARRWWEHSSLSELSDAHPAGAREESRPGPAMRATASENNPRTDALVGSPTTRLSCSIEP